MTDPALEDFGSGLEQPTPAQAVAPVQDSFLTEFRGILGGLPEDITREQLADNLIAMQTQAARAAELEAKNAEYEAKFALAASQQAPTAQSAPSAAPVADEFELPWKPIKVDPSLRALVTFDASVGGYVAKNPASMAHHKAAEEMNQRQMYADNFVQAFIDDPVGTQEILGRRQVAALRKEFADQLAEFKTQITPIQTEVETARAQREQDAFVASNQSKLFAADGQMTDVGKEVDWMMRTFGMPVDQALAEAEKKLPSSAPQPAANKPISLSKVAQPAVNFADGVRNRMQRQGQAPPERSVYEGATTKRPKMKDVFESLGMSIDDN